MNRKHPCLSPSVPWLWVHPHRLLLLKQQMPPPERMSSACCGSRKAHPSSVCSAFYGRCRYCGRCRCWAAEAKSSAATVTENLSRTRKSQREQLAAIFYRYAARGYMMFPLEKNTNILSFADASDITPYAIPCNSVGVWQRCVPLVRRNMFSFCRRLPRQR